MTNGALEGIDFWYELRRARARLDGDAVPERGDAPRRTTFSSLSADRHGRGRAAHESRPERRARLHDDHGHGHREPARRHDQLRPQGHGRRRTGAAIRSRDGEVRGPVVAAARDRHARRAERPAGLQRRRAAARDERGQQGRRRGKGEAQQRVDEQRDEAKEKLRGRLRGLLNRGGEPAPEAAPANPPQ